MFIFYFILFGGGGGGKHPCTHCNPLVISFKTKHHLFPDRAMKGMGQFPIHVTNYFACKTLLCDIKSGMGPFSFQLGLEPNDAELGS